jgi:oligopeptidase B
LALWDGSSTSSILPGELVYLDESALAQGHDHFEVGSLKISPSQNLVAYTLDCTGDERYQLVIQRVVDSAIVMFHNSSLIISDNIIWGPNDETIFYTKADAANRTFQLYCRSFDFLMNTNNGSGEEVLVYEEQDIEYWVSISKSKDDQYLFVDTSSSEASEVYYLELSEKDDSSATSTLTCIATRRPTVLYAVEHFHGTWWITSNTGGSANLQLWTAPVVNTTTTTTTTTTINSHDTNHWVRVLDHQTQKPLLEDDSIAIEDLTVFATHIVI